MKLRYILSSTIVLVVSSFLATAFANPPTFVLENKNGTETGHVDFYQSDSAKYHVRENARRLIEERQAMLEKHLGKKMKTEAHFPSVGIVGAGPAGLLTAIESYRNGSQEVSLWEKRTDYTRPQIVYLRSEWAEKLKEVLGKERFMHLLQKGVITPARLSFSPSYEKAVALGSNVSSSQIDGISKPLKNQYVMKILDLEKELASLVEEISTLDQTGLSFQKGAEFSGHEFNGKQICSNFVGGQPQKCVDWLIGADSFQSAVAEHANLEQSVPMSETAYTVAGIFDRPKGWPKSLEGVLFNSAVKDLSIPRYLLSSSYRSKLQDSFRLFINARGDTLFIGLDLGEQEYLNILRSSDNPELTGERIAEAIRREFVRLHPNMAHLAEDLHLKDNGVKLKATAFPIQLMRKSKLAKIYGESDQSRAAVFLAGDAQWKSHYFNAKGLQPIIKTVALIGKSIKDVGLGRTTAFKAASKFNDELEADITSIQKNTKKGYSSFFDPEERRKLESDRKDKVLLEDQGMSAPEPDVRLERLDSTSAK